METKISHYRKVNILLAIVCFIAIMTLTCIMVDKAKEYTVSATVVGTDYDGYTLFETPDGNIWAYELPFHVAKGTDARLNMYDMSPDGKTVSDNVILSVEIKNEDGFVQKIDCRYDPSEAED